MKTGALVAVNVVVTVAIVAAAQALQGSTPAPDPQQVQDARSAAPDTTLRDDLDDLARRVDAAEASVSGQGADLARMRADSEERVNRLEEKVSELEARLDAFKDYAESPEAAVVARAEGAKKAADKFTEQVSNVIRDQIKGEFQKYYDLVNNPTPELEEQRRMQLKMGAQMFGAQAGLTKEETQQLEEIFTDVDRGVRDELRPLLVGQEDASKLDYDALRGTTNKAFDEQSKRFSETFDKPKAEKLTKGMEPFRGMFEAALDDLEKQSKAEADKQ
ncbi:MAG: hypothetical protein ACYTDX_00080 [Planctomycetota bacterium]|jgi:hypothetical protein